VVKTIFLFSLFPSPQLSSPRWEGGWDGGYGMKEDLLDEVMSELVCVIDSAEEVTEALKRVLRDYNLGRDPELDNEFFKDLLSDIEAMKECVIKAEKLYRETQTKK
jgi:hypothetical protein